VANLQRTINVISFVGDMRRIIRDIVTDEISGSLEPLPL